LKVPLSKSGEVMSLRGFESHPLRRDGLLAEGGELCVVPRSAGTDDNRLIAESWKPIWKGRIAWPSARDWKSRRR
jgi:hypothetical protein